MSSFLRHLGSLVAATIMALPAMPLPAHAQIQGRDPTPEEIVGMMLVDVPLVLDAIDPAVQAGHLWVKGDQPTETLLARFTMKPVQVAQIDGGASGGQDAALLWRAFTGGNTQHLRRNILPLDHGEGVFCGNEGETIRCFADKDGDGRFDHSGLASRERGQNPITPRLSHGSIHCRSRSPIGCWAMMHARRSRSNCAIAAAIMIARASRPCPRWTRISAPRAIFTRTTQRTAPLRLVDAAPVCPGCPLQAVRRLRPRRAAMRQV